MSSSLNLSPDPIVIGVQAGLFLANMYVVKKLMLDPYLKVRSAREAKTGGSQDDAQALLAKAAELDQAMTEKMRVAHKAASATRESIKSAAQAQRASTLAKAEAAAKKEQTEIQNAISANLAEERSKQQQTVGQITDEFVRLATQ